MKLFLGSFRNHGAFHEDCTIGIARRLVETLAPTSGCGSAATGIPAAASRSTSFGRPRRRRRNSGFPIRACALSRPRLSRHIQETTNARSCVPRLRQATSHRGCRYRRRPDRARSPSMSRPVPSAIATSFSSMAAGVGRFPRSTGMKRRGSSRKSARMSKNSSAAITWWLRSFVPAAIARPAMAVIWSPAAPPSTATRTRRCEASTASR